MALCRALRKGGSSPSKCNCLFKDVSQDKETTVSIWILNEASVIIHYEYEFLIYTTYLTNLNISNMAEYTT